MLLLQVTLTDHSYIDIATHQIGVKLFNRVWFGDGARGCLVRMLLEKSIYFEKVKDLVELK